LNVFVNGTTADGTQVNANFNSLIAAGNNINSTNIGSLGVYANQIIPTTAAQATFGGSVAYTFLNNVEAPNLVDLGTANQVITAPKTTTSALSFTGTSARLVLNGTSTNGLYVIPATDTQAGTFVITNAGVTANLLNVSQVSSSVGSFLMQGYIVASSGAGSGIPGLMRSGDLNAQRTNATGILFLGGSTQNGLLDYNISVGGQISASNYLGAYCGISASAFNIASDRRWKDDIAPIAHGLDQVRALKPSKYTLKADGTVHLGFIADEVEAVIPEIVFHDEKGFGLVNAIELLPVLVRAIQQQDETIVAQTARIGLLEARLNQ
jgi:hypothetical protein